MIARTWFLVLNDVGEVLAVVGGALLSEAQETARRLEFRLCLPAYLEKVELISEPAVGDSFPGFLREGAR